VGTINSRDFIDPISRQLACGEFRPDALPSLLAAARDIETLLAGLPSLSMA
jgi:hypothetical protein